MNNINVKLSIFEKLRAARLDFQREQVKKAGETNSPDLTIVVKFKYLKHQSNYK